MNRKIFALSLLLGCGLSAGAQDYFWTPSGDRYKAAESIRLDGAETTHIRTLRHVFDYNRNIGTLLDMIIQYFVIIQLIDRIA